MLEHKVCISGTFQTLTRTITTALSGQITLGNLMAAGNTENTFVVKENAKLI